MKIIDIEAIYVRQSQVKQQCDSGQDALIVRVSTDSGIIGIGEVDSSPLAVKGAIEGPFSHAITSGLRELLLGEDPMATEYLWEKMYRQNIYSGRRGIAIRSQILTIRSCAWQSISLVLIPRRKRLDSREFSRILKDCSYPIEISSSLTS